MSCLSTTVTEPRPATAAVQMACQPVLGPPLPALPMRNFLIQPFPEYRYDLQALVVTPEVETMAHSPVIVSVLSRVMTDLCLALFCDVPTHAELHAGVSALGAAAVEPEGEPGVVEAGGGWAAQVRLQTAQCPTRPSATSGPADK